MIELVNLDAIEHSVKIEMPPRPSEFAVSGDFQPDVLLLFYDFLDLAVFDFGELSGADRAFLALRPRLLQWRGAQQAADDVGTKRRLASRHWAILHTGLPGDLAWRKKPGRCGAVN